MEPPSSDEVIGIVRGRPKLSDLPLLALGDYREVVEAILPPTVQQIEDFASYVSGAKSWYKHLPLVPPGEPFSFFIDPWAGLDRLLTQNGRVVFINRTSETPQFHYTWMTTVQYRSRFGRLAFASTAGTELFWPLVASLDDNREISGVLANNPSRASIHLTEEDEYRLPPEALDAGTTHLTGVIHEQTAAPWVWFRQLPQDADSFPWPEETGGSNTSRRIVARCRVIGREAARGTGEGTPRLGEIDEQLIEILAPERRRLRQEMVLAMKRVVTLLYGRAV